MKFLLLMLASMNAFASVEFEIPKMRHQDEVRKIRNTIESSHDETRVYLNASTYSTDAIEFRSQLLQTTSFKTSTVPALHAGVVMNTLSDHGFFSSMSPELGITFASLERTGTMNYYSKIQTFTQSALLFNALAGIRLEAPALRTKAIRPFVMAGVLPGMIMISDSAVSTGGIEATLPGVVRGGFQITPKNWNLGFNFGAELITPTFLGKNTEDRDLFAGLQVRL